MVVEDGRVVESIAEDQGSDARTQTGVFGKLLR